MFTIGGSSPEPPPKPTPAQPGSSSGTYSPAPTQKGATTTTSAVKGFANSFKDLVGRKFRELRGDKWEGKSDAEKQAEATRRSEREMARRIERETGKKPALSTIRRHVKRGTTPKGVDQQRMDRQAGVDRAGGLKNLAARAGVSTHHATKWRDSGGPLAVGEVTIIVHYDVTGDVTHTSSDLRNTSADRNRRLTDAPAGSSAAMSGCESMVLSGDDAEAFIEAYYTDDYQTMEAFISQFITDVELPTWNGVAERTFVVTHVHSIYIES